MFPNIQLVCCRELLIYFLPLLFNDFKQFDSQNVTNQIKTFYMSQMTPKFFFHNTTFSVQLPYISGHSL